MARDEEGAVVADPREAIRGCTPTGYALEYVSGPRTITFAEWAAAIRLNEQTAREADLEVERLREGR